MKSSIFGVCRILGDEPGGAINLVSPLIMNFWPGLGPHNLKLSLVFEKLSEITAVHGL